MTTTMRLFLNLLAPISLFGCFSLGDPDGGLGDETGTTDNGTDDASEGGTNDTTDNGTTDESSGADGTTGSSPDECSQDFVIPSAVVLDYHPDCNVATVSDLNACYSVANRFCKDSLDPACTLDGDGISGFVTEWNGADGEILVTCVEGYQEFIPYYVLAQYQAVCDGSVWGIPATSGLYCNSAIHHYCGDIGFVTGFGPNEADITTMKHLMITCLQEEHAVVLAATFEQLQAQHPGCLSGTDQLPCAAAAHRHCLALGHESGYGPIEVAGDLVYIMCTE